MHLLKRKAETAEDAPRKRSRPLPGANGATGGRVVVGGVGVNGLTLQAPGRLGRGRSTGSSSSSSSSSESSSDETSSDSDSTSESTSGSSSDSDSDSTSAPSSHDINQVVRPLRRPPPSFESQRKSSQPKYVTTTLWRIFFTNYVRTTGPSQYRPDLGSPKPTNATSVAGNSASQSVEVMLSRRYQQAAQMRSLLALLSLYPHQSQ